MINMDRTLAKYSGAAAFESMSLVTEARPSGAPAETPWTEVPLLEQGVQSILLQFPQAFGALSAGQTVSIRIRYSQGTKVKEQLEFVGPVKSTEKFVEESTDLLAWIQTTKEYAAKIEALFNEYQERQEEVFAFMTMAKGR